MSSSFIRPLNSLFSIKRIKMFLICVAGDYSQRHNITPVKLNSWRDSVSCIKRELKAGTGVLIGVKCLSMRFDFYGLGVRKAAISRPGRKTSGQSGRGTSSVSGLCWVSFLIWGCFRPLTKGIVGQARPRPSAPPPWAEDAPATSLRSAI